MQSDNKIWQDETKSKKLMIRFKQINDTLSNLTTIESDSEYLKELFEIAQEDESIEKELEKEIDIQLERVEKIMLESLLDQEYDHYSAILSIHAGTGGLDAQDWANMLLRMYLRFTFKNNFSVTQLNINQDTEAGIKSVTLEIKGERAYGFLKSEKGVHRLVRIYPFDTSGKRHTSFASIDVIPMFEDDDIAEIYIEPGDIKIDTYRASGPGGQNVNKTESAVRITHLPTNIVVQCQSERSQLINKEKAMQLLRGKLLELKKEEKKEKIEDLQGEYTQIAWGNQIRSYVFHPYSMVKDHRTNCETGNIDAVMDGDLNEFIFAYLKDLKNKE